MKQSKNSCALFIGSCDAYADILDPFFTLLKKYWPDLNYDIFLSTESTNYKHPDFKIKNLHPDNPNCSWTERIYNALKKIKAKQIFFVLDDFFLYGKVNSKKIAEIVSWLSKDPLIATFTLWNIPQDNQISKYPNFDKRKKRAPYKMAMTAGIWNKRWLQEYFKGHKENAWEFENNAGEQSRKRIIPGKFFVLTEPLEDIFPYNLTQYGLFSGKWIKNTKTLFEDNQIKFNFKKRGWYDEKYSSVSQSRIDAFSLNSYIVPCYYFKSKAQRIYNQKPTKSGVFHQIYHVKNGKNFFKWFISDINGYSIMDLKINITYNDEERKPINDKLLFGQFNKIDNIYVFNASEPTIFVITDKDKPFKKIEIAGKIIFPATKNHLRTSFNKTTPPPNYYCEKVFSQFKFESLSSKEFRSSIKIQPEIVFDRKIRLTELPRSEGKFSYQYKIPANTKTAVWTPSNTSIGFSIEKLRIKLIDSKTNKSSYIKNPVFSPNITLKNKKTIIFDDLKQIKFDVDKYDKIIISGKMKRGIKPRFLRKTINNG